MTPKRVIEKRSSSALSVCPSSRNSSSSRLRRVGIGQGPEHFVHARIIGD